MKWYWVCCSRSKQARRAIPGCQIGVVSARGVRTRAASLAETTRHWVARLVSSPFRPQIQGLTLDQLPGAAQGLTGWRLVET